MGYPNRKQMNYELKELIIDNEKNYSYVNFS